MSSTHTSVDRIESTMRRLLDSPFGALEKKIISVVPLLCLWTCPSSIAAASGKPDPDFCVKRVWLHGKSLDLHLGIPHTGRQKNVLVLYGSGDGGWFGAAVDMFKDIAQMGYPVVGFSTKSYLKLLGYNPEPVSVEELTTDYEQIMQQAQRDLALPAETQTILTGWSRGAAFAVLVASEKAVQRQLAGVVVIRLPDKEELNIRIRGKKILVANYAVTRQHVVFDTHERIPRVAPLPLSLIQSTGDDFLPAVEARPLFGGESDNKKFFAVQARNHRFSGGRQEFVRSLKESLVWVCSNISPVGGLRLKLRTAAPMAPSRTDSTAP